VSEASDPSRQVVRFGAFELDLRVGELRKAGVRVNLQEQPFKVLECLMERPGELVTREELRQRLWQGDTFVDFEHGVNAAVKRLRETLGDSAETPRFIETLPRRGYRLIAPVERDQPPVVVEADLATTDRGGDPRFQAAAELPAHPKRWSDRLIGASLLGILVTSAFAGWVLSRSSKKPELPMKVVPFTSLTGFEIAGTFSADGTRVAFTWNGEAQDNFDIYVQMVGSAEPHRLSTDPAFEANPRWSPNNMEIAYLREDPQRKALNVWLMSALGGPGRKLSELPVSLGIGWSPDGRYISATQTAPNNGIYLIPVQDGEPRAIIRPTAPETVGNPSSLSPDGRFLAYVSCPGPGNCYVQIVEVDAVFAAHGSPRRLSTPRSGSKASPGAGMDSSSSTVPTRVRRTSHCGAPESTASAPRSGSKSQASMPPLRPSRPLVIWFFHVSSMTSTCTGSGPASQLDLLRHRRRSTAIRSFRPMASDSPSARRDRAMPWKSGLPRRTDRKRIG
jgi:DNA-binding winged helix-turn-helix (wHTH) protein/Tol biopolymer transport system component